MSWPAVIMLAFCRGAFVQVQSALQQTFPGLEVEGGTYPIPAAKVLTSCTQHAAPTLMQPRGPAIWHIVSVLATLWPFLSSAIEPLLAPALPSRVRPAKCLLLQALAARAVQILQYVLMAVVMFGDHIFAVLGVQPPELYQHVKDKKFGVIMGAWLIGAGPTGVSTVSLCLAPAYHL